MAAAKTPADVKREASARLLNCPGVSGVGLRNGRVVVYLETDGEAVRQEAARIVHAISASTRVTFELTGAIGKQQ